MNIWMSLVALRKKNVGNEGKGGREKNQSGGGKIIKGKLSSPMEWTIKYTHRHIYIYYQCRSRYICTWSIHVYI